MTYNQKLKENTKLISLYDAYLMNVSHTFKDRLKLTTEIARLHNQNQQICNMKVSEYDKDINDYKYKQNSELNEN